MACVLGLTVLTGCGSSLLGTTSTTGVATTTTTTASTTSTTVPVDGEVAVAFPVVACTNPSSGSPLASRAGWNPSILLAPVPTSLVGKVTFYTDGVHTLLGPTGWTCSLVTPGTAVTAPVTGAAPGTTVPAASSVTGQSGAIGAQGSTTLAVYPANDPTPPTSGAPAPGTEGIFATFATTGGNGGVGMVCAFFTLPSWQTRTPGCSTAKPPGETSTMLTPDVVAVSDPVGAVGSLAASGGQMPVTGVILFPQVPSAVSYGSPLAVATESCALTAADLCPTVLSDFDVREFPVPVTR
jgi:hypothetical protein